MPSEPSRASGFVDQAIGSAKETFGHLTNNEQTEAEGKAQHAKGEATDTAARTQNKAEANVDSYMGAAKKKIGELFGNEQAQAEGSARETKGDIKNAMN